MRSRKELKNTRKVAVAVRKIKPQFPVSPEGKLFFKIVEAAIKDAFPNSDKKMRCGDIVNIDCARLYLHGNLPHAEACGVSSAWIRLVLRKVGLQL